MQPSQLDQMNVLLIEDEPITRTLMENLLHTIGLSNVTLCEDGEQALVKLGSADYDLIFSDIEMPGNNGLEVLKQIRCGNTQQARNSRLVLISSHDSAAVLGTAIALDADAIISKQISVEHLKRRVTQLLLGPQPEIRSSLAYEVIRTDQLVPEHAKAQPIHKGKSLPLDMLQEGMVLAGPIYDSSGHVLMPTGEELTLSKLSLLKDLEDFLVNDSFDIRT